MVETTSMPAVIEAAEDLGFETLVTNRYCIQLEKGFIHVTVANLGFDGFAMQRPGYPVEKYRSVVSVMARLKQLSQ